MSIFSTIAKTVLGPVFDFVAGNIHSGEEKAKVMLELKDLEANVALKLEESFITEMNAKKDVIIAELNQGDKYTKRARPSLVYSGMGIVFLNYIILPWIAHFTGEVVPSIEVPAMFWTAWAGVTGSWVIGRSAERRGIQNKFTKLATGNKG